MKEDNAAQEAVVLTTDNREHTMHPSESSLDPSVTEDATLVYNYHRMDLPLRPTDAIFVLCSLDLRVAERGAQLWLTGYGEYLIFSGGVGKLTAGRFAKPEAEVFADIAREMGVPDDKIIVENKSTNTGENVRFTYSLLQEKGLQPRSLMLVQKPYMERRTWATFRKQWPNPTTDFTVTSPQLNFASYPNEENPRDLVIEIMVGDLVRIRDYPARGFQVAQEIPDEVWEASRRLIAAGYDGHLP
jgi:uncharacterized SAM-binding protein YcdF (DUF218 family)